MKYFRMVMALFLFLSSVESLAQSPETVEMADILRRDGKIYTVVFGLVIILTILIIILVRVDRKIFRLEKQIRNKE